MEKIGLAIHPHHNILVEHCWDYDKRVAIIKSDKPKNQQEIRLRVFKLLPPEAIVELPQKLIEADVELEKADVKWEKTDAKWDKARAELNKIYVEWEKAYAEWEEADVELTKARVEWDKALVGWDDKEAQRIWHKKWCGCKEWNGRELVF